MAGYAHTIEQTLRDYSKTYGLHTFVETGTFKGTTTEIASKIFKQVYTIELSETLYSAAKVKFKDHQNITCIQGESAEVLKELIKNISENTLFFLDAHWAGDLSVRGNSDSPLLRELTVLASRNGSNQDLVIIDDVSFFDQKGLRKFTAGSAYFPEGGIFEWDWSGIDTTSVLTFFPGKKAALKDDRLCIGIRE